MVPARPELGDATLLHLLTHTSGISEIVRPAQALRPDFGESVAQQRPVPTPAEFYRGALHTNAEPGTRWIYTDHGFATVGQIIEDVSGVPLARYLREHIFGPR
ncbi:serine hydrolase [Nocardia vulneris]|uniref:serine hydrolase n=1 Tax=Nocardia vulneris TaxID=1141657 RepID=UPI0009E30CCA|nr:serine hydrolase domain-containing protein [Nocardia vulneris]